MREIPLTKGLVALVDDADYGALSAYKWYALRGLYAVRSEGQQKVMMHRALLRPSKDMHVDHINGNGLDNRRENIRLATPAQNSRNRGVQKNNRSGYKGVFWDKIRERWMAKIWTDGRQKNVGRFSSPEKAHAAYCAAATELHQDFARFQ